MLIKIFAILIILSGCGSYDQSQTLSTATLDELIRFLHFSDLTEQLLVPEEDKILVHDDFQIDFVSRADWFSDIAMAYPDEQTAHRALSFPYKKAQGDLPDGLTPWQVLPDDISNYTNPFHDEAGISEEAAPKVNGVIIHHLHYPLANYTENTSDWDLICKNIARHLYQNQVARVAEQQVFGPYADPAYHFGCCPDGKLYELRPNFMGGHAHRYNEKTIGIVSFGAYEPNHKAYKKGEKEDKLYSGDKPTQGLLRCLAGASAAISQRFAVDFSHDPLNPPAKPLKDVYDTYGEKVNRSDMVGIRGHKDTQKNFRLEYPNHILHLDHLKATYAEVSDLKTALCFLAKRKKRQYQDDFSYDDDFLDFPQPFLSPDLKRKHALHIQTYIISERNIICDHHLDRYLKFARHEDLMARTRVNQAIEALLSFRRRGKTLGEYYEEKNHKNTTKCPGGAIIQRSQDILTCARKLISGETDDQGFCRSQVELTPPSEAAGRFKT